MSPAPFFAKPHIIRFLLVFFLVFGASQVLLEYGPMLPLQLFLADVVGKIIGLHAQGTLFPVTLTAGFEITPFCTGITSMAMLLGLLFGFEFPPLTQKIRLAGLGIAVLFAANILRVASVVGIGIATRDLALAEQLHTLTWFIMSALVLGTWYWGMKKITKTKTSDALARKLLGE